MTVAIPVPFNPANYLSSSNPEGYVLGGLYSRHGVVGGGVFRFGKNIDAVSITIGMGVCFCQVTLPITDATVLGRFTVDRAGGSDNGSRAPAGMLSGSIVVPQNYFCFVMVDGVMDGAIDVGSSIAAGATVMADTTNDGKLITLSGSKGSFGVALAASSANVFPMRVSC